MEFKRREFMKTGISGAALTLAFQVGGGIVLRTPEEAKAEAISFRHLSPYEATWLEVLADSILPGATVAGVAHFVDHQLGVEPDDCLLIAKYFPVPQPFLSFYRQGLEAVDTLARRDFKKNLLAMSKAERHQFVGKIGQPETKIDGFDVSLFYICLRSDAVDVVYGTPKGFKKLNVPYMAHIMPPEDWNG